MKEFFKANYLLFTKIILTIYILYSLKYLYLLKNIESEFYMNITFLFVIAAVYLIINYAINILRKGVDKRLLIISLIMGLYFAFVAVLGAYYEGVSTDYYNTVLDFTFNHFIISLKYIPALWFLFLGCILFIYIQIPTIYNNHINKNSSLTDMPKIFNKLYKIWLFIFICWLPYFILLYPGYVFWDTVWQIEQLFSKMLNTHHPLVTTFYLYFIKFYYNISHNGILSLALYVLLFQMLPLSFIYAYMINKVSQIYNINKIVVIFLILFAALYPANPLTSILIEKSIIFIIFFILFMIKVVDLVENKELLKNKKYMIEFIIIGIILCLTRNNVIYGIIVVVPFMLLFARKYRKYIFITFAGIFIGYILLNTAFVKMTGASKGAFSESMSMPVQQLARVYKYNKTELTEDEIKFIEKMMANKDALNLYEPKLSNNVKFNTNSNFFKTKEFIVGYIKLGLKYPGTYLNSIFIMTSAILYPFENSFWQEGLWYRIIDINQLKINEYDLNKHKQKLIQDYMLNKQYRVKDNNSLMMFFLFNQSFLFYALIFVFMYFIYKKLYKYNFILLIPLGYTATLLLGPIIYYRYTYFLAAILPILIMMLTNKHNNMASLNIEK